MLDFLPETEHIRSDPNWRVAPPAPGLVDRRVEITGPTERKMTINALNSGANVWLADFEDANTPLWENMIGGQLNLMDALDRTIDFTHAPRARSTRCARTTNWPRSWSGRAAGTWTRSTSWSTASARPAAWSTSRCTWPPPRSRQIDKGKGPYFYLAKNESHLEARLWNDAFNLAQDALGIPRGTIRATVLIETIPAAFEMDEILYELRDHSAGLNAGRWDYLFSMIKKFRTRGREFVLPERNSVTMTAPFMRAYTELLVKTCHRRGAHAIGGMAAFIPNRRDPEVNEVALAKVREDKLRESSDGFDGSWVAHPDLVPICKEVFDAVLGSNPNQIGKTREDVDGQRAGPARGEQDAGRDHRGRAAQRHQRRAAVPGRLAGRQRRGGHLQPDGGRGHRGDLPVPGLAVDPQRHRAGRRADRDQGTGRAAHRRGAEQDPRRGRGRHSTRSGTARPSRCSPRWRWPTTSSTSSPCPPTSACPDSPAARCEMTTSIEALAPRLREICGAGHVITDPLELRTYECDGLTSHRCVPALAVLPATAAEVASVVGACAAAGVPFVARGSGTGLSGGALPRSDGVLIVTVPDAFGPRD